MRVERWRDRLQLTGDNLVLLVRAMSQRFYSLLRREFIPQANVKPRLEVFKSEDILPPSPLHIVQSEVEDTIRIEVSSPAPTVLEHAEEALTLEESVPIPHVHEEVMESTEFEEVEEYPLVVQEGSNVNTVNVSANVHSQPEEIYGAHLIVQEGDKMVQLPSIESGDRPVQKEAVDPSINKEAVLTEVFPTAIDVKEENSKPLAQSSEVLGTLIHGNSVFRRYFALSSSVFLFSLQMT